MGNRRMKKLNNRGYAMVTVIIAMALAIILVSVLLSVSYLNYKMKLTEYKTKDNFYSAEKVLDEINVGLRQEVSDAAGYAYLKAIQTYKMKDDAGNTISEADREANFKADYINYLRTALSKPGSADDTKYYIGDAADYDSVSGLYANGILSYLDKGLIEMYQAKHDAAAPRTTNIIDVIYAGEPLADSMISNSQGLVLKDLKVIFIDSNGYYSEIKTDIEIGYPNISLQETSTIPNVFDYAFVANKNLEFTNTVSAKIKDSIFAGESIELSNASGTEVTSDTQYVIAKGDLNLDFASDLSLYGMNAWVRGINVTSGSLDTDTKLYVADDLTVNGINSEIKMAGSYYGYSSGAGLSEVTLTPDKQSSIIVNGSMSDIDLTGLRDLLLGGNAFIRPGSITVEGHENHNVITGSSLAVKTDQIAFLVPAECIGTKNGLVLVGKNPMTKEDYDKWVSISEEGYKMVDEDKVVSILEDSPSGKHTLKEYLADNPYNHYETVFHNVNNETICYVYLKMTQDSAAEYYRDYMYVAEAQMENYASKYGNEIKLDRTYTDISSRGNLITILQNPGSNESSVSIVANNLSKGSAELDEVQAQQESYEKSYLALCSKLTTNYNGLTEIEKNNGNVYVNVINATALDALTKAKIYRAGDYTSIVSKEGLEVNNQQVTVDGTKYDKVKLIISAGDVTVTGSFKGLIIAGGNIILKNTTGAVLEADKENVTKLLQTTAIDDASMTLVESFFVGGSNYSFHDSNVANSGESYVDLDGIVVFTNWTKQ